MKKENTVNWFRIEMYHYGNNGDNKFPVNTYYHTSNEEALKNLQNLFENPISGIDEVRIFIVSEEEIVSYLKQKEA